MSINEKHHSLKEETGGKLFSSIEREACMFITSAEEPYSQQALALIAIDDGATQAEAGQLTGLTIGQVQYWLAQFRKEGMAIFPDALFDELEPEVEQDVSHSPKEDVPGKKAKQDKKPKKKEVAKKEKKGKKGKKRKNKVKVKKGKRSKKSKKKK